jgi:23S rRNA (adenine2030-N6)-methyltransferase
MLSYRHGFHAGNHADVLKHSVLIHCIQHFLKKPKPFLYVDTHSGAGRYALNKGFALKNREFEQGVDRLRGTKQLPPILADYAEVLQGIASNAQENTYPGSPIIAAHLLRANDQLRLHELHSSDYELLNAEFFSDKRATVIKKDGFRGLIKAFPPPARRAIALIDPSYEIERDYVAVPLAIDDALFKFPSATILIWYPMLPGDPHLYLKEQLLAQGHSSWLWVENKTGNCKKGMYGSGMWVINPPWTLPQAITESSSISKILSDDPHAGLETAHNIP